MIKNETIREQRIRIEQQCTVWPSTMSKTQILQFEECIKKNVKQIQKRTNILIYTKKKKIKKKYSRQQRENWITNV